MRRLRLVITTLVVLLAVSACTPQQWMRWRVDHGRAFGGSNPAEQVRGVAGGPLAPIDSLSHPVCHRRGGGVAANPCPAGSTGPLTAVQVRQVSAEARTVTAFWSWAFSEAGRNARADHAARNTGSRGTCTPTGIFYAESGGNWTAANPSSTASGGLQFLDSTWAGHRGYARAMHAPPWVQWERFLQTWNGGAGRSHWAASVCR